MMDTKSGHFNFRSEDPKPLFMQKITRIEVTFPKPPTHTSLFYFPAMKSNIIIMRPKTILLQVFISYALLVLALSLFRGFGDLPALICLVDLTKLPAGVFEDKAMQHCQIPGKGVLES
jgi:hypothetical protein